MIFVLLPRMGTKTSLVRWPNQGGVTKVIKAPVAQLDRASVYGTEGCWFESSQAYSTTHPLLNPK